MVAIAAAPRGSTAKRMAVRYSPSMTMSANDGMQATFGGGEANVAVSLANFGIDSTYVTKLPEHAVGQAAVNSLRYFGVNTEKIVRGGDRVGIYYLEKGISQRPSVCIYDRKYSAVAQAAPSDFDWNAVFENADWFHITGITPALSDNLEQICLEAVKAAKTHGVPFLCYSFNHPPSENFSVLPLRATAVW